MASFLHAADLHLGASFSSYPRPYQEALQAYQRGCLAYLIGEAINRNVDAIVFAGDFFDNPTPSKELMDFVLRTLKPLEAAGIPFILALGNHDAGLDRKVFNKSALTILSSHEAEKIHFDDWTLVGISYKQEWDMRRPLDILPKKTSGLYVGLFHSGRGEEVYMPLAAGDIEKLSYDYLALGHVHSFSSVDSPNKAFYSGALSQFGSDRAGFLFVNLAGGKPEWISSPAFPIKEYTVHLKDIGRDLERVSACKDELITLILKGELDEKDQLYLDHWKKNNRDIPMEDKTLEKKEFQETPLYRQSKKILISSPESFLDNLELLAWSKSELLNYIGLHKEDLLLELKDLFRGIYD